uniref:Shootin-1 n=1 Tax=Cairina moschata TaxID=8855 RepID=A0A8C3CU00_CAIMO
MVQVSLVGSFSALFPSSPCNLEGTREDLVPGTLPPGCSHRGSPIKLGSWGSRWALPPPPQTLAEEHEARAWLDDFQQASQALLAELSALEAECEIQRTCRQQAEAYAAQVQKENTKLKRLSLALPPGTGDGDVAGEGDASPDPAQELKGLQEKLSWLLVEKKELSIQVQELQRQNRDLQEQLEKEKMERQSLRAALDSSQRTLKSFKRVSQVVTQDYCEALQKLELEQDLRLHAEAFAHKMLVAKKEASRQSSILLQSAAPGAQLLRALQEVGSLSRALEEARQQHQQQVRDGTGHLQTSASLSAHRLPPPKGDFPPSALRRPAPKGTRGWAGARCGLARGGGGRGGPRMLCPSRVCPQVKELEEQLGARPRQEELELARAALAAAEEGRQELRAQLQEARGRLAELEAAARSRQEEQEGDLAPSEPAPPPPPPPLPPPAPTVPVDPLLALRQRKGQANPQHRNPGAGDAKAQAVQEMMERIKNGVVLRPAKERAALSQSASKRRSAALELRGILGAMRRASRRPSGRRSSVRGQDRQLEAILQRRRRAIDVPASPPRPDSTDPGAGGRTEPGHEDAGRAASPSPWHGDGAGDPLQFRRRAVGGISRSRPCAWQAAGGEKEERGQPQTHLKPARSGADGGEQGCPSVQPSVRPA